MHDNILDKILYLYYAYYVYYTKILIGSSKPIHIIIFIKYAQYIFISQYREVHETVYTY
jgi:hypothetical protein